MPSSDLIVVGGGGHAAVVIDAALSSGAWKVIGFVDPRPDATVRAATDIGRLGDDSALASHRGKYGVLGFGSIRDFDSRAKAVERLAPHFAAWGAIVHARAVVSPSAKLGEGAVVCAGAIVQPGAVIGRHTIVNTGAIVEHDVTLGDFSQVAPGGIIGGGTIIGSRCWIGLGAAVRDNIRIGDDCVVAMGATVVKDVTDRSVVKGTPAR